MGFFDNMFQQQLKEGWKELTSLSELEELNTRSFEKPMVIFKHSTRCGISAHAKDKLNAIKISDAFDFYYLGGLPRHSEILFWPLGPYSCGHFPLSIQSKPRLPACSWFGKGVVFIK